MSSEHQLESHGMELVNQNKLWAGIVFTNVPNDQKVRPKCILMCIHLIILV